MSNVVDEKSRNTSDSSGPSSSAAKVKRPRNVTNSNSNTAQDRVEDQEPPTEGRHSNVNLDSDSFDEDM